MHTPLKWRIDTICSSNRDHCFQLMSPATSLIQVSKRTTLFPITLEQKGAFFTTTIIIPQQSSQLTTTIPLRKPQHLKPVQQWECLRSYKEPNADIMLHSFKRNGWQLKVSVTMVIFQMTIKFGLLTGPSGACFPQSTFIFKVKCFHSS